MRPVLNAVPTNRIDDGWESPTLDRRPVPATIEDPHAAALLGAGVNQETVESAGRQTEGSAVPCFSHLDLRAELEIAAVGVPSF